MVVDKLLDFLRQLLAKSLSNFFPSLVGFLVFGLISPDLYGQIAESDISTIPKPVGSGARALGQSAFIAVADDATAASWNPAGLSLLRRPELSVVGAWAYHDWHFQSRSVDRHYSGGSFKTAEINYLSLVAPLQHGSEAITFSLNYHQVFDFGLDLERDITGADTIERTRVRSEGAIAATSFAASYAISPPVSIGLAVNVYSNKLFEANTWKNEVDSFEKDRQTTEPFEKVFTNRETFKNFRGWNVTLGLLWNIWEKDENLLTLGGVIHTPFTAEVDRRSETVTISGETTTSQQVELEFPISMGIGVNYRVTNAWSIATDVEWKDWSNFRQYNRTTRRQTTPIGGGDGKIADTIALRLGTQYIFFDPTEFITKWALRGGVFYDPRPALDEAMDIYGLSLGTGWTLRDRVSWDLAYQYRYGEGIDGQNLGLAGTVFDVNEHWFVSSIIIYF